MDPRGNGPLSTPNCADCRRAGGAPCRVHPRRGDGARPPQGAAPRHGPRPQVCSPPATWPCIRYAPVAVSPDGPNPAIVWDTSQWNCAPVAPSLGWEGWACHPLCGSLTPPQAQTPWGHQSPPFPCDTLFPQDPTHWCVAVPPPTAIPVAVAVVRRPVPQVRGPGAAVPLRGHRPAVPRGAGGDGEGEDPPGAWVPLDPCHPPDQSMITIACLPQKKHYTEHLIPSLCVRPPTGGSAVLFGVGSSALRGLGSRPLPLPSHAHRGRGARRPPRRGDPPVPPGALKPIL